MAVTAIPAPAPGRSAHRDANVLRWLTAYTASLLGDSVYFVALAFAAAKSVPPAQVGLVMAAGAVPRAALMLGGGVIADRFGPRRVVIGSDALRCVLILCAAAALVLSSPGLWLLVSVALVFGVVDALFMPAVGALPPRLVAPDQLARLQGMRALAVRCGDIAGPPLGGLAMGLGGAGATFALAGGLFAVSVPLLVRTRIGRLPAPDPAPDARVRHPAPRPAPRPAPTRPRRGRRPGRPPGPNCATGCATSAGTPSSGRSCCPEPSARSAWSDRSTSGWCCSPRTAAGARPATAGSSRRSGQAPGRARCC